MANPLSFLSINQTVNNPPPPTSNTNTVNVLIQKDVVVTVSNPQVLQSKKWVSPLSEKGLLKREAETNLADSVAKKKLGFQPTSIKNLASGLPLSIPIEDLRVIEEVLGKIENHLTKFPVKEISAISEEMRIKNLIYYLLHQANFKPKEIICELSLFLFYLVRDQNVPTIKTAFFEKRLQEIIEELDYLEGAFFPSLSLCASGKIDYILNVFARHMIHTDGTWNQAGCLVVSRLLNEPRIKRLFSYEYESRLKATVNHLFSDSTTISSEIRKYNIQALHPSMEWIVRCDLKLDHQTKIETYHVLCAAVKMLLVDMRQASGEGNCFSVAPIETILAENPKNLFFKSLNYLFEGEFRAGNLSFPLSSLVDHFLFEELIATNYDRKELETSTHLLTVLTGIGLKKASLPQQDSFSFSSLSQTNNNNASSDLFALRFSSSLKYNYLQSLVLKVAYFSDINNLIASKTAPIATKTKISFLRSQRVLKSSDSEKGYDRTEYGSGRLCFFDPLFSLIKEELTTNLDPDDFLAVDTYFTAWTKLLLEHLWFFPLRTKPQEENDVKKFLIVKEDGSSIEPPEDYPKLFQAMDGLVFIKDHRIKPIYTFMELGETFLQVSQEALKAGFEKNKKVIKFHKKLIKYFESNLFYAHLFVKLNDFHADGSFDLDASVLTRDFPLIFSPGGSGIRVLNDFFQQKREPVFSYNVNKDVHHFFLGLHEYLIKFFQKRKMDFHSYNSLLADSQDHVFTLNPQAFSYLLNLDSQNLNQWIEENIVRRGKETLKEIVPKIFAEKLLKKVFPDHDLDEMLDLYFSPNLTFQEFCDTLKADLSSDEIDLLMLSTLTRFFLTSIVLNKKNVSTVLKLYLKDAKGTKVDKDKIFDFIQRHHEKDRIEPFALARLFREALLDQNIDSLSPQVLEQKIVDYFLLPASIELADLNYEEFGSSRETPEHSRLCIEFDYLTGNLAFTKRALYKTLLLNKESTAAILKDFKLRCIV